MMSSLLFSVVRSVACAATRGQAEQVAAWQEQMFLHNEHALIVGCVFTESQGGGVFFFLREITNIQQRVMTFHLWAYLR